MYKSGISDSIIKDLQNKVQNDNYGKYLKKININRCRAFEDQTIKFDFPVTALIGPNGGGKTTILGASAILYSSIAPRQFFTKNLQLDEEMENWSISYWAIDRDVSKNDLVKRSASYISKKWNRKSLQREVLFFGVSRTIPAVERKDLSKFAAQNVHFSDKESRNLSPETANAITKVLGKDVSEFIVIKPNNHGNITLLSGKTDKGKSYSEFHFGAGESSIIKMIMSIEGASSQSLILIEEIENGLHPLVICRLVDYLINVARRKKLQVIFTTHSEYAIKSLPSSAIWASINGKAAQGKLTIESLRTFNGESKAQLIIYVEDDFAKDWLLHVFRHTENIALNSIDIYPMNGENGAVQANKYHNQDPSNKIKSICILDGDSRYEESETDLIFKLPGEAPEIFIFYGIKDFLDKCSSKIAIRCGLVYEDSKKIENIIKDVANTTMDHHNLFSQIGKKLVAINENIIRSAFLATWCEEYQEEMEVIVDKIKIHLPKSETIAQ